MKTNELAEKEAEKRREEGAGQTLLEWRVDPKDARLILGRSRRAPDVTLYIIALRAGSEDRGRMSGAFISDASEDLAVFADAKVEWLKMQAEMQMREFLWWHTNQGAEKEGEKRREEGAAAGSVMSEITAEVERAMRMWPTWPTDPLHAFAVVGEEFGETQKEVLQLTYEPHKSSRESLRKEAVQLAAMSIRFLLSFDRYEVSPGVQHTQNPGGAHHG